MFSLCTTTIEPVVIGDWISAGTHVTSIDAYAPTVREVDTELILKVKVVTDSRLDALRGAGELVIPMNEGLIKESHLYAEIGEIASGAKTGRSNNEEITFCKSMGMAVQDVATANYIWKKALAAKLCQKINHDILSDLIGGAATAPRDTRGMLIKLPELMCF